VVDDGPGPDHVEDGTDLGRPVVLVDVDRHGAGPVAAEHGLEVLGAVEQHQRHRILAALPALELGPLAVQPDAVGLQEGSEPAGAGGDLAVGPAGRLPDHHGPVGHRPRDHVVHRRQRPLAGRHR
jgi:hypothetical protein